MATWRAALHAVRVDVARLRHLPRLWLTTRGAATTRGAMGGHQLATASSPLRRSAMVNDEELPAGKDRTIGRWDGRRGRDDRTVPFVCGATVFYSWADLRFVNPLDQPVSIQLTIGGGRLCGALSCATDPGLTVEVYEVGHRFVRDADGAVWRQNQLRRRISDRVGMVIDQLVADNRAKVAYPVDPAVVDDTERAA
jgi:hypothetical protein